MRGAVAERAVTTGDATPALFFVLVVVLVLVVAVLALLLLLATKGVALGLRGLRRGLPEGFVSALLLLAEGLLAGSDRTEIALWPLAVRSPVAPRSPFELRVSPERSALGPAWPSALVTEGKASATSGPSVQVG